MSTKIAALSLCLVFSMLITLVPHLNPENRVIGVDTIYYVNWIKELDGTENAGELINHLFTKINSGDRPLSIFLLYLLAKTHLAFDLSAYLELVVPLILSPSLSIVFTS
jgi:hypothetical protein